MLYSSILCSSAIEIKMGSGAYLAHGRHTYLCSISANGPDKEEHLKTPFLPSPPAKILLKNETKFESCVGIVRGRRRTDPTFRICADIIHSGPERVIPQTIHIYKQYRANLRHTAAAHATASDRSVVGLTQKDTAEAHTHIHTHQQQTKRGTFVKQLQCNLCGVRAFQQKREIDSNVQGHTTYSMLAHTQANTAAQHHRQIPPYVCCCRNAYGRPTLCGLVCMFGCVMIR